jgi:hypothetical protein
MVMLYVGYNSSRRRVNYSGILLFTDFTLNPQNHETAQLPPRPPPSAIAHRRHVWTYNRGLVTKTLPPLLSTTGASATEAMSFSSCLRMGSEPWGCLA